MDAVCTNMLLLHAAGLIDRNRYSHKKIIQDRELLAPGGKPVPEKERVHVSLSTKAIRLLKADGTITTGTNPTTLRDRLLSGRDGTIWSHQNNALEGALDLANLHGGLQPDGSRISFELDKSDRELHHEQAAFLSVPVKHSRGMPLSAVLGLADDKLEFDSYKGRLIAPDATLVKTITYPDGSTHRTYVLLEYDQGNYARAGILEGKMEMLSGPFGAGASVVDPEHDDSEIHEAYDDSDDLLFADEGPSQARATESSHQKASRYWAAKASEYDDLKLVFVSYNDAVRRGEERRLGASYEPTEKELDSSGKASYIESMEARKVYVNAHCEFVTLHDLETGERTI